MKGLSKYSFWNKLKDYLSFFSSSKDHLMTIYKLQAILDNTVDSIITTDANCIIIDFNKAAEKMFGYSKKEALYKNISIIMPSPDKEHHDEFVRNYLTTGIKHVIGVGREALGQKKDGTIFPVDISISETIINHSHYFTGIIKDLTLQKEANKIKESHLVIEASMKAREAEIKAKNDFLTTISHELRTPLHGIMGFTECLIQELDGPLLKAQKNSLQNIYNASKHLLDLVSELLLIAKGTAIFPSKTIETCPLSEILTTCIETLLPLIKKKKLDIHKKIPEGITLQSNTQHLQEIFFNLLSNAIKFTEKGSITVRVSSFPNDIVIQIADTGCGIQAKDLQNIFIPFSTSNEKSQEEHTGLGLAITKHLVEIYKGKIKVSSEVGVGSIFTITFPLNLGAI